MFVIEGVVGARIGDDEFAAGPGVYLNKPRAVPHTMWNAGPDPARVMEITTPGGLEAFVEGLPGYFRAGDHPIAGHFRNMPQSTTQPLSWTGFRSWSGSTKSTSWAAQEVGRE